jgi:hypothetical protein
MKLQDLLKDIELGKVYTDKDKPPFKVNEGMRRFKVYVSGESEPLILLGKNEKEVKQVAHQMIQNSSVKIKKVVKEGKFKLSSDADMTWSGNNVVIMAGNKRIVLSRKELAKLLKGAKMHRLAAGYEPKDEMTEGFGGVTSPPPFSSPEAKKVVDDALRKYSKELRKLQGKVVKDWMAKAKNGVIDFFDLARGFQHGDLSRAYPYEVEFLQKVLTKDKIVDRFRKYFGGKKGKKR